jgi:hypothetical protein
MQALAESGPHSVMVRSMSLPDAFMDQDSPGAMYAKAGLDSSGIIHKVFETLALDQQKPDAAQPVRKESFPNIEVPDSGSGSNVTWFKTRKPKRMR